MSKTVVTEPKKNGGAPKRLPAISLRMRLIGVLAAAAFGSAMIALVLGGISSGGTFEKLTLAYAQSSAHLLRDDFRSVVDGGPDAALALQPKLKSMDRLKAAVLFGGDGETLMSYQRDAGDAPGKVAAEAPGTVRTSGDGQWMFLGVERGTVLFIMERPGLGRLLLNYLESAWLLIPLLVIVAVGVGVGLEHLLSGPLRRFAAAVSSLRPEQNPGARLPHEPSHELGVLTDCVNGMLDSLEQSQRLLLDQKHALDQAAIVSMSDAEGRFTYVNKHFCDITGYRRSELIGSDYTMLRSSVHDDSFYDAMWEKASKGEIWRGEICNRDRKGELFWLEATLVPMEKSAGGADEFLCIQFDITARKQAETALLDSVDAAQAADRAKTQFVANLSHEIRTPMNGVVGMLQMLRKSSLNDKQQRMVGVALRSLRDLVGLLRDMLDYATVEKGQIEFRAITFRPANLLSDVVEVFATQARERGVELSTQSTAMPDQVIGDPFRLKQVLNHLVENAIKFSPEGGKVEITAQRESEDRYRFEVIDEGMGIPRGAEAHIFQFFTQLDARTTREFGGVGLGLALARGLVDRMGGVIGLERRPERGSIFWFTANLECVDEAYDPELPDAENSGVSFEGAHALLVEDNEINRMVAVGMLRRMGVDVDVAINGAEAVKRVEETTYDIILMDCQMPVMDGFTATQAIRKLPGQQVMRTPIIAVTAYAMKGDRDRAFDAGMDDYLTKPIEMNVMETALSRWLPDQVVKAVPLSRQAGSSI
ncbi:MAG: response regulator [Gammaproteobacteria bacterium]